MRVGLHVGPVWVSSERRYRRRRPVLALLLGLFWLAVLGDMLAHALSGL